MQIEVYFQQVQETIDACPVVEFSKSYGPSPLLDCLPMPLPEQADDIAGSIDRHRK